MMMRDFKISVLCGVFSILSIQFFAQKAPDYDETNGRDLSDRDNLNYIVGDATNYNFDKIFDKIILSNVLEHIEHRIDFLVKMKKISNTILLRVPIINRS